MTNSFDAPTLSILILREFAHPDLMKVFPAAAGSITLLLVCLGLILFWSGSEKLLSLGLRRWLSNGRRDFAERVVPVLIAGIFFLMLAVVTLGLLAMLIQAMSFRWVFPDVLPESWIFQRPEIFAVNLASDAIGNSVMIALGSTGLSLVLALMILLSADTRKHQIFHTGVYIPLILPQVALMMGVQLMLLAAHLPPVLPVVILAHSLFVLPYVYLSLAGAYQRFDWRYAQVARSLGAGFWRRLWRVVLPMTTGPILVAFAIGFAVSMAQYLPCGHR